MTLMQKNQVIKKTMITVQKGMQKIEMPRVQNRLPTTLDLMFVIDTTGSMGDELRYITTELKSIIKRVKHLHPATAIRYGLVVYRDKGDQYVVQSYPFQNSLSKMEALLSQQSANGGGDYPEAMDVAMKRAMKADWKAGNTARMLFLIADAPPHDNTISQTLKSAHLAHQKGIRIYPVGASGVADKAEYVMRHMALISNGRYLFLTDDSGVGNKHQEPHVACYVVTRLDQLMSRVISAELAGRRVEPSQAEVKRKVGDYDNGVCHLTQTVQQTN
jgi:Mg-chelatase subunit ChlD